MNKREFNTLHKICRDSWNLMSKRGMRVKLEELDGFKYECPACEIAGRTKELSSHISRCRFCPITKWRNVSIRDNLSKLAVCKNHCEAFERWEYGSCDEADEAAKEIAELEWSFLPEYKDVVIPEYLLKVKINAKA